MGPEQSLDVPRLFASNTLEMIRVSTPRGASVTLFTPSLRGDTLVGIRDAGPTFHLPLDSVSHVDAYLAAPPPVSTGEWVRLGILVGWLAAVGLCALDACPVAVRGP
ncbi:MAG: hypothetical protein ACE5PT_09145 [Gemmatimonadales bacterium]